MPETTKYLDLHGVQTLVTCIDNNYRIQVTELPTASESLLGKIYQYIGNSDTNYTNGQFYKCISDGASTPTYSWENINVNSDPKRITAEELSAMWEV